MSLPKIPDMNPNVTVDRSDAVNLILFSIGMEEIGLSHIINAEGENLQCIIKKMEENVEVWESEYDIIQSSEILLRFNNSINETIKNVFRSQSLLQLKLEDVKELYKMIDIKDNSQCNELGCIEEEKEYRIEKRYGELNRGTLKNRDNEEEVTCKPIYINRR